MGAMQKTHVFAGAYLDRAAHLRDDAAVFAAALADRDSLVVPVWNSRNLILSGESPRAAFIELSLLPTELVEQRRLILLGTFGGRNTFATELSGEEAPQLKAGTRFEELRMVASLLPADEAGLLSYARAMIYWHSRHRFCGVCGTPTQLSRGGHVVTCTNPSCKHESFPRIDPAIIVLVSDGERALLGRQASWPAGRYSTIAGFVEPGESLEDAVAREVYEETGIEVDDVAYHSSQPWPFPSSLMLGFMAHARTTTIRRRDQELEDAQWFSRAQIASGYPKVPPGVSISYRLIEHWFDAGGGTPLAEVQGLSVWPATGTR
jgi:NAD+ diphosphatase